MIFSQNEKLIIFTDQFQYAEVETVRKAGSRTTYWLKTKNNSFPIETIDDSVFLYPSNYGKRKCVVMPVSNLLAIAAIILLLILFVI